MSQKRKKKEKKIHSQRHQVAQAFFFFLGFWCFFWAPLMGIPLKKGEIPSFCSSVAPQSSSGLLLLCSTVSAFQPDGLAHAGERVLYRDHSSPGPSSLAFLSFSALCSYLSFEALFYLSDPLELWKLGVSLYFIFWSHLLGLMMYCYKKDNNLKSCWMTCGTLLHGLLIL